MQLSIITTCKGRLDHLRYTLPLFAGQHGVEHEVIVVDYSDPDECHRWIACQPQRNIRAVCVPDRPHFNLSHARNCGARIARGGVLVFLDADVLAPPSLMVQVMELFASSRAPGVVLATRFLRSQGQVAVLAGVFHAVRGYDETLEGWGYEDNDFADRVEHAAGPMARSPRGWVHFIEHDDQLRTEHYAIQKDQSHARNMAIAADVSRVVNPYGYGRLHARNSASPPWASR